MYVLGFGGGSITPEIATVEAFTLANYTIHKVDFPVGGNEPGAGTVGLLGQNLMRMADVEYDLGNQNLDRALTDCNAALRLRPKRANFLDSRGLARLRRGEFDLSITDYDAALALRPKLATSLYGRGLGKLRKGLEAEGKADLAAASALDHDIAELFAGGGLRP